MCCWWGEQADPEAAAGGSGEGNAMIQTVEDFDEATLFERKDRQLINWLNEQLKGKPGTLICTHEQIAIDIGSVREVVSRMLEDLQKSLVTLSRGKIRVKDQALFDVNKTRN